MSGNDQFVEFAKWYLDDSKEKQGRIWSAKRDHLGIGRPLWTPGDVMTRASFDLFESMMPRTRQYLFLPPNHPGPGADSEDIGARVTD